MRWIISLLVLYAWEVSSWAQDTTNALPVLNIVVDLPNNIDPELAETLIVEIGGEVLEPTHEADMLRFSKSLQPGRWTIKALIPGWGADAETIRTTIKTRGKFQIKLRPHLTGLDLYADDVRLEWVGVDNQRSLSAPQIKALRFVDSHGTQIKISRLADARLSCRNWIGDTLTVDDYFDVESDGLIAVIDPDALQQRLIDCDMGGAKTKLTILAEDKERGLAYERSTKSFRFGHVTVKGRVVRGRTTREYVSLANRKVVIGGRTALTHSDGSFEIENVPIGSVTASVNARAAASAFTPEAPLANFWARASIELYGPAEIEMRLELWDYSKVYGPVDIISQAPFQRSSLASWTLADNPAATVPPNARFKLVNLSPIRDVVHTPSERDAARMVCGDASRNGWRIQDCLEAFLGRLITKKTVWSGPGLGAKRLGDLIIDPDVWFVPEGSSTPSMVVPDYYQSDWGYSSFGYAVTVLSIEQKRVAIHLPQTDEIGWLDLVDLQDENWLEYPRPDDLYIGFSPLESCLSSLGSEQVILESTDKSKFTYRFPTPHDLWSIYSDTEQPPQTPANSYTRDWRSAYSAERRLILLPNAGKEC